MLYVKRDKTGQIVAVSKHAVDLHRAEWSQVDADAPELLAFSRQLSTKVHFLSASDMDLIRVLEDLIELLIEKGAICFTDFPVAAQRKLLKRRDTRAAMHAEKALGLLGDGGNETI